MRITTAMLNFAHRRAGVSKNRSSLLNYVGQKGGAASRLRGLNATDTAAARIGKSNYDRLEKSADSLRNAISSMTAKADDGSEDKVREASALVEDFNQTLKNLKGTSGALNGFYLQSMKEISGTNSKELAEIGITVAADGSLSLNQEKFAAANAEKVKKLLGSNGSFAQRAGYVASRVSDNAAVSAASSSSRYNSVGGIADYYSSKYNFWS